MRKTVAISLVVIALILDQGLKFWVKTNMYLGQTFDLMGDWAKIHFIENEGMAFGMTLGGDWGKPMLSIFRIVAVIGLGWVLKRVIESKEPMSLVVSLAMILAGAIGNIIDSLVYGVVFSASEGYREVATFLPEGGGYAAVLYGKVVDMFYFPLIKGFWPEWLPFVGGDYFIFFRPVFNVADSFITLGIFSILIFHWSFLLSNKEEKQAESLAEVETTQEIIEK